MSISQNVGGMSKYLGRIRSKKSYLKAKKGIKKLLVSIPGIGKPMERFFHKIKEAVKALFVDTVVFENFGFSSGKDTNKFKDCESLVRSNNGIVYIPKYTNAYISAKVVANFDCGSHTLFICDVVEAKVLSSEPSVTYDYYFAHIKPKPPITDSGKKAWVCKICGYAHDDETESVKFSELPDDWVCPLCKHPKSDFEYK
jgi:rubredoxin